MDKHIIDNCKRVFANYHGYLNYSDFVGQEKNRTRGTLKESIVSIINEFEKALGEKDKENEELKKEINTLKESTKNWKDKYYKLRKASKGLSEKPTVFFTINQVEKNYISKDKIREILDKLEIEYKKELDRNSIKAFILKCEIKSLKELLEDK